ncbi:hypothetical protein RB601_009280 [Gaeumannomyces tritici]
MHRTKNPRLSRWLVFAILACLLIQGAHARPSGGRRHTGYHGRRLRRGAPRPHARAGSGSGDHARHEPRQEGTCAPSPPASIKAPKRNLWAQLSEQEVGSVVDWLFRQRGLNLTRAEDAGDWDNTIISVEVMRPNKTDALAYMDGNGPAPPKYARVTLDQRATENPVIAELLVGPLPIDLATTSWSPLAYPFTKASGGRVRNLEADAGESLHERWLYRHTRDIADVTRDLLNGTLLGRRNDTLEIWGIDPLWQEDDGRVRRWDTLWNLPTDYSDAQTLLPTGIFLLTDVTGRDPGAWRLEGWLYGGVFYNSTAAFRAAYWSPGFEKLGVNVEGDWARTDHRPGPGAMPLDDRRPPVLAAPGGSRFSLDPGERYVEWMGFSFHLGFCGDTGVSLHDVRFGGERVLWELGLQEALSHYAGNDPVQAGTAYLDNSYGFGRYASEMVVGFDAPAYATYLDMTSYEYEGLAPRRRAVALFEAAADHALQRHSTDDTVSVTRNTYFVVRQVATVANYDYTVSYTFTLSGEVAVDVRASGFVQGAHRSGGKNNQNDDSSHGYALRDNLSGSMHDHVIAFKADFDVAGAANTVELVRTAPAVVSYPWPGGLSRSTMRLERTVVASEAQGRLDWDAEGATQVRVVNRGDVRGGEPRGYRVVRSGPTARLTVRGSPVLKNAARWAEHDLHVTRHKDAEPWLSHASNNQDVADPLVDFSRFAADDEALVQEDVVLWLNLGMHHVPVKEDLPNTLTTTAHSGVRFVPSNFGETDPSRRTVNMARISYREGRTTDVVVFGQSKDVCSMRLEPDELGLWSYAGGSAVHVAETGRGGSSRGQGRGSD